MKKNQNGFSMVEGLLILLIVGIIGFVGWYVWRSKNQTDKTLNTAATTSNATNAAKTTSASQKNVCQIVPTTAAPDWKTFTDDKYKFSISYPSSWGADTSGGAENNSSHTPILNSLQFTPPGNQGPQYGIEVTAQSLTSSIADWKNSVKEAQSNSAGTTFTIVNEKSCSFDGHNAESIDTKQAYGTTTVYDGEFYVAANGYSYKFSTGYQNSSDPFKDNASLLGVVQSISIK